MTTADTQRFHPIRRRLRVRVVASFALLAIAPFLFWMVILFYVSRTDVLTAAGSDLAERAQFLAEELSDEIDRAAARMHELASLPEVRDYLAGRGPFPQAALHLARRLEPGLRDVILETGRSLAKGEVELLESGDIRVRSPVVEGGNPLGTLTATFQPVAILNPVLRFRMGLRGEAVLAVGELVIGGSTAGTAPPGPVESQFNRPWGRFDRGGKTWYASSTLLGRQGNIEGEWRVAVMLPETEILRDFYAAVVLASVVMAALAAAVLLLAWRFAGEFLRPLHEISTGAEIISRINLAHRIELHTGDELEGVARQFNAMAEALQKAYGNLKTHADQVTGNLQEERNRLAAVLRAMSEGVVAMNELGEVILMNPRARSTLGTGPSTGIGAPLSRIVPSARLEHHLRRLRAAWDERRSAVEAVLFPLSSGQVLRGGITGIADPSGARAGFLFVFRDVTADAARDLRVEEALRALPLKLKGPLASLSSMIEILQNRTDLAEDKRSAFLKAIGEEVERCLQEVEKGQRATVDVRSARWPAQPVDPRELVESALSLVPGVFARHEIPAGETFPPVAVEPYGWIAALATAIRWLAAHSSGWKPLEARLEVEEEMIVITFHLTGNVTIEPAELEALCIESPGENPYSLGEAVRRNHGEIWTRRTEDGFEVRIGMMRASLLPPVGSEKTVFDDQPEFYDFDLFLTRPGVEPAGQLASNLTELEYVVFDTETTGLSPSQGDRVVSLSAVRVRNGKANRADTFHTLVHPGIPIPPASIAFHGITDEMVRGAPSLAEILPQFSQYVGRAVLVGHNVAFDKKFLDLAAADAKLPLMENPILDTLFLSYGVHGDIEGHNLDAIAARLGVTVEGRHTSLGDARATADVFLHLLELLPSRGVRTLAEAKAFCDKMLLLRWQMSRY